MDCDEGQPRPLSILHVKDNRMVADAVKEALEMEGWRVETYRDAAAALQSLEGFAH